MKKVLFCAAFVAALSMAFVACGKKENKAAEGEQKECCDKAACAEKVVCAFEAAVEAGDYEKAYQISMEADEKLTQEDFTPEQQARLQAAFAKVPFEFIQSKMEQEQAAAAAAANAEEEDEEDL